jgi:hypothetical protein
MKKKLQQERSMVGIEVVTSISARLGREGGDKR